MEEPYGHLAGSRAGAMLIIIGMAAYISMKEGKSVKTVELLKNIVT